MRSSGISGLATVHTTDRRVCCSWCSHVRGLCVRMLCTPSPHTVRWAVLAGDLGGFRMWSDAAWQLPDLYTGFSFLILLPGRCAPLFTACYHVVACLKSLRWLENVMGAPALEQYGVRVPMRGVGVAITKAHFQWSSPSGAPVASARRLGQLAFRYCM